MEEKTEWIRDGQEHIRTSRGGTISRIELLEDRLRIEFVGRQTLVLLDTGQDCCEHRYMTCDDDLRAFAASEFMDAETREMEDAPSDEFHEQQALLVTTSKGVFTVVTHNIHNGYYGGFSVDAQLEP